MTYERLFQKDGNEINYDTRIHFPSNRFSENNLSLTDEEINEIKNKFSGFQKNIYYFLFLVFYLKKQNLLH